MFYDKNHVISSPVSVDYDTAGDNVLITPGEVIWVKRLIMVCTEVSAGSSIATLKLRNVDDTSSVTLGTFTVPAAIALNAVRYVDLIKPSTTGAAGADSTTSLPTTVYTTTGKGPIRVVPGQELEVTSDGVGTAGIFNVYVEYGPEGFNEKTSLFTPTELTFTAS